MDEEANEEFERVRNERQITNKDLQPLAPYFPRWFVLLKIQMSTPGVDIPSNWKDDFECTKAN